MSFPDSIDGYGPLRAQKKAGFVKISWDRMVLLDRLPPEAHYPHRVWSFYGISFGRWFSIGITLGRRGRD